MACHHKSPSFHCLAVKNNVREVKNNVALADPYHAVSHVPGNLQNMQNVGYANMQGQCQGQGGQQTQQSSV